MYFFFYLVAILLLLVSLLLTLRFISSNQANPLKFNLLDFDLLVDFLKYFKSI